MAKLFQNKIYVKKSPIHGYGVFAKEKITANEIVEECHTLILPTDFSLLNYLFDVKGLSALPLGYGAIYNHADTPNACYDYIDDRKILRYKALRDIKPNEEILISYGANWFSGRRIDRIEPSYWRQFAGSKLCRALLIALACIGITYSFQYLVNMQVKNDIIAKMQL